MLVIPQLLFAAVQLFAASDVVPLAPEPCFWGTVHPLAHVKCRVPIRNDSSKAWIVSRVVTSEPGIRVSPLPLSVPPGSTGSVELEGQADSRLGRQTVSARVAVHEADADTAGKLQLQGSGFVYSLLDHYPSALLFDTAAPVAATRRELDLSSQDDPDFRVRQVVSAPSFVDTELAADGHSLTVRRSGSSDRSPHTGKIVLATNSTMEPRIEIPVRMLSPAASESGQQSSRASHNPGLPEHSRKGRQSPTARTGAASAGQNPGARAQRIQDKPSLPVTPAADPPGSGPVLRWSVSNEQTLYGYLIYRAEHKNGPWRRVNDKIIPVLGHDDATSEYAWRDTSAVKGTTYWYFIKTLANDGSKKKLTGLRKVVAH